MEHFGCLGLDYYPLLGQGQRFPINAPDMLPRMTPRPGHASFSATAACAIICSSLRKQNVALDATTASTAQMTLLA